LLIDPDRLPEDASLSLVEAAQDCGVDALLVGTSFMLNTTFGQTVKQIKRATTLPVIIFPGSFAQVRPEADAILFTSLISGRNPAYLIDEQVRGAPLVKAFGLEAIPTGYMLIESGRQTSVQYISGTQPIPRTKADIACAHALAAQYLGMKLVYLEAGSGADQTVPIEMVREVAAYVDIPLLVGGGLSRPEECARQIESGASFVVIGSILEDNPSIAHLTELAAAVHPRDPVTV
ncbi:MAG TPA: geranylgeranylglyceryl/heptaprenylglyceryl phosphate synthase, partial [Candidatus Deferrimicrobium sp.]|nr:geranylgeranylglyceryl/heptaprenylglyceryl phosphate synthase [Candidatus Deferrimicrobium sp.]